MYINAHINFDVLINVSRDEDDLNQSDPESMSNGNGDDSNEEAATIAGGEEAGEVDQTFEDAADNSPEGGKKEYR